MTLIVPPGGFAGLAQMTPAGRAQWSTRSGGGGGRRRRRKVKAKSSGRRRTKRKLKFGSPAWRKKYLKK